jgi:hypothetical protein
VLRGGGKGVRVKLYKVEWSGHCYVVAESRAQAEEIALDEVSDPQMLGLEANAAKAADDEGLGDWTDALPLGKNMDEKTCDQWLVEQS